MGFNFRLRRVSYRGSITVTITVTFLPASVLKKYRPMTPLARKPQQTVYFSGWNGSFWNSLDYPSTHIWELCFLTYPAEPEIGFSAEQNFARKRRIFLKLFRSPQRELMSNGKEYMLQLLQKLYFVFFGRKMRQVIPYFNATCCERHRADSLRSSCTLLTAAAIFSSLPSEGGLFGRILSNNEYWVS